MKFFIAVVTVTELANLISSFHVNVKCRPRNKPPQILLVY